MGRYSDLVPTNWCDSLLTGPNKVLPDGHTYNNRDIERLLQAIRTRIYNAETVRQCAANINTRVYVAGGGGRVMREPGERCSLNATVGDLCHIHARLNQEVDPDA